VYKGVEQSTANIQMVGNVYGLSTDAGTPGSNGNISRVTFSIGLAPGAPPIDLTKMKIVFSTPTTGPVILSQGPVSGNTIFTTRLNGNIAFDNTSMSGSDQIEVNFTVVPVPPNTKMTMELRPSVGAALPFSKTAPPTISATNVLY
jgi:archaeal flagellin FlaB